MTTEQWNRIKDLGPDQVKGAAGKGRPDQDKRHLREVGWWILHRSSLERFAGALSTVSDLPQKVSAVVTTSRDATLVKALAKDLQERCGVDLSECFLDGYFCLAKKGALLWQDQAG